MSFNAFFYKRKDSRYNVVAICKKNGMMHFTITAAFEAISVMNDDEIQFGMGIVCRKKKNTGALTQFLCPYALCLAQLKVKLEEFSSLGLIECALGGCSTPRFDSMKKNMPVALNGGVPVDVTKLMNQL